MKKLKYIITFEWWFDAMRYLSVNKFPYGMILTGLIHLALIALLGDYITSFYGGFSGDSIMPLVWMLGILVPYFWYLFRKLNFYRKGNK